MPPGEDMSEFEKDVSDITDPSPWDYQSDIESNAREVVRLLNKAAPLIVSDIIKAMNQGRVPLGQYLIPTTGASVTFALASTHRLSLTIQLPLTEPGFYTSSIDDGSGED